MNNFTTGENFYDTVADKFVRDFGEWDNLLRKREGRPPFSDMDPLKHANELLNSFLSSEHSQDCFSVEPSSCIPRATQYTTKEALKSEFAAEFKETGRAEWYRQFKDFGALEPIDVEDVRRIVNGDFSRIVNTSMIHTAKFLASGEFNRFKSRLVACQTLNKFDVTDKFSPTVLSESVRIMLQMAVSNECFVFAIDVAGAYLYAEPSDKNVILRIPPGLLQILGHDKFPKTPSGEPAKYLLVKRAIYGLQRSCQDWYRHYTAFLLRVGFTQSMVDQCVWFRFLSQDDYLLIAIFSDNNLIVGKGTVVREEFMTAWRKEFKEAVDSDSEQELTEFLGLRILVRGKGDDRHVLIDCPNLYQKLEALLHKCSTRYASPLSSTNGCDEPVSATNPLVTDRDCRSPLGLILYITISVRIDCVHDAVYLARYVSKGATKKVAAQVDRLGWFLCQTQSTHVLRYNKSDNVLKANVDASFANDKLTMRSWYGYCLFLGTGTGAILSKSTLGRSAVSSTRDSELIAALHVVHAIQAIRIFLSELHLTQITPTEVVSDSMAAVQGVTIPHIHKESRWMAIRFAAIREAVKDLLVAFIHGPGKDNCADIFTKILSPSEHFKHAMTVLGSPLREETMCAILETLE